VRNPLVSQLLEFEAAATLTQRVAIYSPSKYNNDITYENVDNPFMEE